MLQSIFTALRRLTASINRSADLFDAANEQLETRMAIADEDTPTPIANGRRIGKTVRA